LVSRTRLTELARGFEADAVAAGLDESPALLGYRDERGRNWLHLCCATDIKGDDARARASVRTADVLLARGFDVDQEAFTEGAWKATPLWFAVGGGRNLALAEHLLKLGCNPNYSLFAAGFKRDLEAIRLLLRYGADVDDLAVPGDTPFVGMIKWSHFEAAEELLKHGANVNAKGEAGLTALHLMLKKGSDKRHFQMLIGYGARGDIPGPGGQTAIEIMRRKKDPDFRRMAEELAG
jgi:ankyrin repeat protein